VLLPRAALSFPTRRSSDLAVYEAERAHPWHFPFRRGCELAAQTCLEIARQHEVWVDVGCGTGDLAAELAARELRVTGVDHDGRRSEEHTSELQSRVDLVCR